jgi:hypothetical protein
MIPYLYIRIPGDAGDAPQDKPFAPLGVGALAPISGLPEIPTSAIEIGDEVIGLLEELVAREDIVIIDGLRLWTRSKCLDGSSGQGE